jgi:replicative DNA helicase
LSARKVTLPPVSVDAERAVLGAILIEGVAGYRKLTRLRHAEQFLLEAHREIFTAMGHLVARGSAIDILTVTEELRHSARLEAVGGSASLALLTEQATILVNLPDYEGIVVDEAIRRDFLALGKRLEHGATNSRPWPKPCLASIRARSRPAGRPRRRRSSWRCSSIGFRRESITSGTASCRSDR